MLKNRWGMILLAVAGSSLILLPGSVSGVELESHIQLLIRGHDLGQTTVSVMAMDLDNGKPLVEIEPDQQMIPASNMKLFTTAAAMDLLGDDFMFRTVLGLIEPQVRGEGHALVLLGDGDPAFCDPILLEEHNLTVDDVLNQWFDAVEKTGVKHFNSLILDDRVFDYEFVHSSWPPEQLHKHYCAEVAGLNFYENCLDISPIPNEIRGLSPHIVIFPEVPFIKTANRAITGTRDQFAIDRRPGSNDLFFSGQIRNRPGIPYQVTVHDPAMVFARLVQHRLAERGIRIDRIDRPDEQDPRLEGKMLHVVQTALPLVIQRCNRDSQNMFAEALFKRMGRAITGMPGSWENGVAAIRIFLHHRMGSRSTAITIADGSGMSRDNRVTSRIIVELLYELYHDPEHWPIFRDSLAEGCVSGTLRRRFDSIGGKVYGKSGYLRGVSALSGYLILPEQTGNNMPTNVGFSMIFNGFTAPMNNTKLKEIQEKIIAMLEDAYTQSPSEIQSQVGG